MHCLLLVLASCGYMCHKKLCSKTPSPNAVAAAQAESADEVEPSPTDKPAQVMKVLEGGDVDEASPAWGL